MKPYPCHNPFPLGLVTDEPNNTLAGGIDAPAPGIFRVGLSRSGTQFTWKDHVVGFFDTFAAAEKVGKVLCPERT